MDSKLQWTLVETVMKEVTCIFREGSERENFGCEEAYYIGE